MKNGRRFLCWPRPICFGVFLQAVAPVCILAFTNSVPEFSSRLWQMEDGLPHVIVHAITQTPDGYLWVGTREGLARFDGVRFESLELTPEITHPTISALHGARDGSLWIGTENFGLFHLSDGKVSRVSVSNGVTNFAVEEIQETADGVIWVNSNEGVQRIVDGRLTLDDRLRRTSSSWWSIATGADGTLWAVCNGMKHVVGGVMTNYTGQGLPNSARKLCCGRNGVMWAGINGGLIKIKDSTGTLFRKGNGPGGYVSVVYEDQDKNVWIGTYLGLFLFVDGEFINQRENDEAYRVYSIFQDREGNIWVGSEEGLAQLTPKRFTTYTKRQGLTENNIVSVCPSWDGSIWISIWGSGINHLTDNGITVYNRSNGLATDFVMAMCEGRDGSLWIGTDIGYGLCRLKDEKIIRYDKAEGWPRGLPVITALVEARNGILWVGTRDWVGRFQDEKFTCYTTTQGLSNNKINAICEGHDGTIWLGTDLGVTLWKDGQFVKLKANETVLKVPIFSLYEDADGVLWIGTKGGGLGRLKEGALKMFTSRQGLFSDSIYAIVEDARDNLWLNTSKGIFHIRKKEVQDVAEGKAASFTSITYGKADGIISSAGQYRDVTQPAACKTTDGRLWFRTTQGVAVVDPEEITINRFPPPVVIEAVIADRKRLVVPETTRPLTPETQNAGLNRGNADMPIQVPPGGGELEIRYTALSLRAAEKNRFKYKLEGVDSDWVDAGTRRYAYYNNVKPGSYRFRVIASNNDGVWNNDGAAVALVLQPHFWQTWWFLAACGLTVVGSLAGTVRYVTWKKMQRKLERVEQQHAIEKERARIARDMHDELGAKLTRISFQGASAQRGLSNPTEVAQQIERMSQTARDLVSSLDEIVWAVDPENDTLDHLANYICRHASDYFEHSPTICRLVIPANLPHRWLATDVRHNIFLAVKESLANVLKHSEARQVEVRLVVREDEFEISISDDGHGFDYGAVCGSNGAGLRRAGVSPDGIGATDNSTRSKAESDTASATQAGTKRTGHGMANIRERLADVNGRGEVTSEPGRGTCVRLVAPLLETIENDVSSIHPTDGVQRSRSKV